MSIDEFMEQAKHIETKQRKTSKMERMDSKQSNQSMMSKRSRGGGGGGVSNIIVKALQDRMETINAQINDIHAKATDNFNNIEGFMAEFYQFQKESKKDVERREELDFKLKDVDKLIRNIEVDWNKNQEHSDKIKENLKNIETLSVSLKE